MTSNMHDAEPIPPEARAEIDRLLQSGDLFRYTAPDNSPVTLLEQEFAEAPPSIQRSCARLPRFIVTTPGPAGWPVQWDTKEQGN